MATTFNDLQRGIKRAKSYFSVSYIFSNHIDFYTIFFRKIRVGPGPEDWVRKTLNMLVGAGNCIPAIN